MTAYTAEQLQALKDALANGMTRVKFADRDVQFRSIQELKEAISVVSSEVAATSGTKIRRQIRVYTGKGL
jgi:hypothetical protein